MSCTETNGACSIKRKCLFFMESNEFIVLLAKEILLEIIIIIGYCKRLRVKLNEWNFWTPRTKANFKRKRKRSTVSLNRIFSFKHFVPVPYTCRTFHWKHQKKWMFSRFSHSNIKNGMTTRTILCTLKCAVCNLKRPLKSFIACGGRESNDFDRQKSFCQLSAECHYSHTTDLQCRENISFVLYAAIIWEIDDASISYKNVGFFSNFCCAQSLSMIHSISDFEFQSQRYSTNST